MMASDPWGMPVPPPLPRRVPRATVGQLIDLLLLEPDGAQLKILADGREVWAKGLIKTDPDGNVVIC